MDRVKTLHWEAQEFYTSLKFESLKSSVLQILAHKTELYHREHGESANIIVISPEFRILIGKDILDFRGIPIIYSLNLTSETNFEKSIQVF
ncbi:hypothetical protein [Leptospira ellinghausenii]|nr:hypothetical protein [Leptospira ellinghausenii]